MLDVNTIVLLTDGVVFIKHYSKLIEFSVLIQSQLDCKTLEACV